MAVKLRLNRMGSKKAPFYRIVAIDSRAPRDAQYIEQVGYFDPRTNPETIVVNNELVEKWIKNGAQPTDTVRDLLVKIGAIEKKVIPVPKKNKAKDEKKD